MKENLESLILQILQGEQYVSIETLAEKLYVSPSTVRRKLTSMQEKGLIIRTHGGAKLQDSNNFSPNFTFRIHQNSLAKKKIALAAIKLIHDGDIVFLDGSTSSFFIAEYLAEFKNIRVITNGIDTLSLLSKNGVTAYSTGGYVQEENRSALVGRYAEDMVKNFHANVAFFSAQSISPDGEIYDCFEEENFIRKAMLKNASVKVYLGDNTKFERKSPYYLCHVREVDYVISNTPLLAQGADQVQQIITD